MVVVLILGILVGISVPNFLQARETARTKTCIQALAEIQGAKEQWAMDRSQPVTATPTAADLYGVDKYIRTEPRCPSDGRTYTIGSVNEPPACLNGGAHRLN
jgi:Tfp pilus assembly protein PilE